MAALTAGASPATDPGPAWSRPGADRSAGRCGPVRSDGPDGPTVRSWPLLVLAVPAATKVWSGWVGIAQKTGFGLVSPPPDIWLSLQLDTAIALPVGVEAYSAYALRAWLARDQMISAPDRRFARWSAICSSAFGMAGQVSYHLMAQAGMARALWAITTVVSCLPILVMGMGTALAHMLRADAEATGTAGSSRTGPPAALRSVRRGSRRRRRLQVEWPGSREMVAFSPWSAVLPMGAVAEGCLRVERADMGGRARENLLKTWE